MEADEEKRRVQQQQREDTVTDREKRSLSREEVVGEREQTQRTMAEAQDEIAERNREMRQANQNLVFANLESKRLTEDAELVRRQQDEFLAMLAHELRNPLSAIRNAAALLARLDSKTPAPPAIHQVLERQAGHMARLLDDLLDASRVTSGKVQLQRRPTLLAEFIDPAVKACSPLIQKQHQQLTVELPEAAIYVDGDPMRLEQVVSNLLHNAAKYTDPGGAISVHARVVEDTVEIRIADNGIGIAADVLPHIFDLFTQNDRSLSRSQGGLGIGLTVVRGLVQLHGGTIEARSPGLDQGSEFIVTLPRVEPVADGAAGLPKADDRAPAKASILLVDDNADASDLLAMVLRFSGHDVATAVDGPEALARFTSRRPQVVVCDIGLPGMDGYEVARRMIEQSHGAPMPVMIALTGYGGTTDRERALAAGFDHHIVKPASPDDLLALIDGLLKRR